MEIEQERLWKGAAAGLFLILVLVAGAYMGEFDTTEAADPQYGDVTQVLHDNIRAYNQEDYQLLSQTLHPDSPVRNNTLDQSVLMFGRYDLRMTISNVSVVSVNETEALVEAVQTTRKQAGPQFRDNRVEVVHELWKHQGEWKIYLTEVNSVEYLN